MLGQSRKATSVTRGSRAGVRALPQRMMISSLALGLLCLTSCASEDPLAPGGDGDRTRHPTDAVPAVEVTDLEVVEASTTTLTVRWTQVDGGASGPASYRIKYGPPPVDWNTATVGCEPLLHGDAVGQPRSCVIEGLVPASVYEVQAMSFRVEQGQWQGAVYSNVATGLTARSSIAPSGQPVRGIWIGPAEIAALPVVGPAWNNVLSTAQGACGTMDLADQNQDHDVCIMAKALVHARTGEQEFGADVRSAIEEIVAAPAYDGRALSLGRALAAYVIAADLIGLPVVDPDLDARFRIKLRTLLTTPTSGGPENLVACHERRPNNWGTHCGASRAAVAAYLDDATELARVARVFKGWLGDRTSYAGFSYGDTSWQCDPERPVGINPAGCTRDGYDLGGVLPDDQRRGGGLSWPPPKENYVWEALQGAMTQAVILDRAGYPAFEWEDRALLRAVAWLHDVAAYPAEGDDAWQAHLVNHYYGFAFPAPSPARPGKGVGWTDWTHAGR